MEIAQLGLVAISLYFGSQAIRKQNHFNYHAIAEVAALFIGIFICMQPALQILAEKGSQLGRFAEPCWFLLGNRRIVFVPGQCTDISRVF